MGQAPRRTAAAEWAASCERTQDEAAVGVGATTHCGGDPWRYRLSPVGAHRQ